jgi:hypothetical protein
VDRAFLFLDELNAAPAMVQASCYQLVLDRQLGEYTLPEDWAIIAAGNRDSDRAATTRMPTPLRNRFVPFEFEVDLQEWSEWAIQNGIRPEVIAFLRFRPELLSMFDRDNNAFPISTLLGVCIADSGFGSRCRDRARALCRDCGNRGGHGILGVHEDVPRAAQHRRHPDEPVPGTGAGRCSRPIRSGFRVGTMRLGQQLRPDLPLSGRMPTEFSVLCVRDASLRAPGVRHTAGYTKWVIDNHHVLA